MKKNRLAVFALTASLLLSGCSLKQESQYENALVEPVVLSEQVTDTVGEETILKSELRAPSTDEEYQELTHYLKSLEGENQVIIYNGTSALTEAKEEAKESCLEQRKQDQSYSEALFVEALKQNPMLQIYYCGSEEGFEQERAIAILYPNVTYVAADEHLEEQMNYFYRKNQVCGYCIQQFRDGKKAVQNFDLEETVDGIQSKFQDTSKEDVIDGLNGFCDYVQNTTIFQKGEEVSDKVADTLKPYVEKAIPKVENAWEQAKPYIDTGIDKAKDIYEDVKPEVEDTIDKAKEKIKSIFQK